MSELADQKVFDKTVAEDAALEQLGYQQGSILTEPRDTLYYV